MKGLKMRYLSALGIVLSFALLMICPLQSQADQTETSGKIIRYSDYGAKGNGETNDLPAIARAHQAANKAGLPVEADSNAVYYLGESAETPIIQTDTDWKNAHFIIDDSMIPVKNRQRDIFIISSALAGQQIKSIKTLRRNQEKLLIDLSGDALVSVTDNTKKRFIRYGANQNNGTAQTDVFIVDAKGKVDSLTPIIWDFDNISSLIVYPMDTKKITVRGGFFTTKANQAESRYTYYARGIKVNRSNTLIDGVTHAVVDELDHGAPYNGFINVSGCANVTVRNCKFSGHKTYRTIGSGKVPVSMGSYDITLGKSCNITFKNCSQINNIHDTSLWGVLGSNFTKNVTFDNVVFSRYDAHMGVTNVTIKNSSLGQQGINLIGTGTFLIENSKVFGSNFISLRSDYGSTFEGDIIIRNCEYTPRNGKKCNAVLLGGSNSGQHDFGYPCHMPRKIIIDGLTVHDNNSHDKINGLRIFNNFNKSLTNEKFVEKYHYNITENIIVKDLKIESGRPWIVSDNDFMFRNVKITKLNNSK